MVENLKKKVHRWIWFNSENNCLNDDDDDKNDEKEEDCFVLLSPSAIEMNDDCANDNAVVVDTNTDADKFTQNTITSFHGSLEKRTVSLLLLFNVPIK